MLIRLWQLSVRQLRRVLIFIIGMTVVLIGVVMVVTPGPAVIVIPIGLAILAVEFAWARALLKRFRDKAGEVKTSWFSRYRRKFRGKQERSPDDK